MKITYKQFITGGLCLCFLLFLALPVASATLLKDQLDTAVGDTALKNNQSVETFIGKIIKVALGLVGVIMFVVIVYAGFLWMTAGGDEDKVKKAKDWMKNAVIGIIIVLAAYIIVTIIVDVIGTIKK